MDNIANHSLGKNWVGKQTLGNFTNGNLTLCIFTRVYLPIHTNELRSYGSKLVVKTSPECPEHSPKLDAQLPRNNFCCPEEYAWESEGV